MTQKFYFKSPAQFTPMAVYAPSAPTDKVIIAVHGKGGLQQGDTDNGLLTIVAQEALLVWLISLVDTLGYILIIPKLATPPGQGWDARWEDNNFRRLQDAENLAKTFNPKTIYMIGHSWGGQGATGYPASSAARRATIAATITIAGCESNVTTYSTLKTYPVYFAHDKNDNVVPISEAERVYSKIGGSQPFDKLTGFGHGDIVKQVIVTDPKYLKWLFAQSGSVMTPPVIPPVEPPVTNLPKANAGPDVTINTNTYELDGSASTGYSGGGWVPTGGSGAWWTVKPVGGWSTTNMKLRVMGLTDGKYEFLCYVYDSKGNKSEDKMTLTVAITAAKVPFASSSIPPGKTSVTVNTDKSFDFS